MQARLWEGAAALVVVAAIAMLAERARGRRRDPDRVGMVPWLGVQVAALVGAVILAALAITERGG